MEAQLTKVDGKWTMDKDFNFMCSLLRNGEYTVTIKKKTKPRSLNQNALYWVWLRSVGNCFAEMTGDEFWCTKEGQDNLHNKYAKKYLSYPKEVNGHVEYVTRSTTSLTTAQMSAYMEKIKADVATEFGMVLPLPQDRYYSAFIDQYGG